MFMNRSDSLGLFLPPGRLIAPGPVYEDLFRRANTYTLI